MLERIMQKDIFPYKLIITTRFPTLWFKNINLKKRENILSGLEFFTIVKNMLK